MRTPDKTWSAEAVLRYWVGERHRIYLKKEAGDPWPWTADPVLRAYRFTNVSRRFDKLTKLLWADLAHARGAADQAFRCVLFRLFNRAGTWALLRPVATLRKWDLAVATRALEEASKRGDKLTSGVWMVGAPKGVPCYLSQLQSADLLARQAAREIATACGTLESARTAVLGVPYCGPFVANEVLMDLAYGTRLLDSALDRETWVTLGPGSVRGIRRITEGTSATGFTQLKATPDDTAAFWRIANGLIKKPPAPAPALTVHDVEHCLCEYDKYARALFDNGHIKNRYRPPA